MKSLLKEFGPGLVMVIAMLIGNQIYGGDLPSQVPVHYNVLGEADRYQSSETFFWLMPVLLLGAMLLISILLRVSPRHWSMPNSRPLLGQMYFALGVLLSSIHFGTLLDPTAGEGFLKLVTIGGAIFLIVFGNVMGKSERNFFIGLRLPWTIASDNNWSMTHRLTGALMVVSGLIMGALAFTRPSMMLFVIGLVVPIVVGCVYSLVYYLTRERSQSAD